MNSNLIILVSILSVFMILMLNWIYFMDWLHLLGKIVHWINPQRKNKEIEFNKKLRGDKGYIIHIKKWKKIFLVQPIMFLTVFLIMVYVTKQLLIAYFCGLIVNVVLYGLLGKKEQSEKQVIVATICSKSD